MVILDQRYYGSLASLEMTIAKRGFVVAGLRSAGQTRAAVPTQTGYGVPYSWR